MSVTQQQQQQQHETTNSNKMHKLNANNYNNSTNNSVKSPSNNHHNNTMYLNGNGKTNGKLNNNNKNNKQRPTGAELEAIFKAACDAIENLPKNGSFQPSNELKLKFYAYFKQVTCGPCNRPRPSMFKVVEKAKWDAWNSIKHMSKEDAMNAYIDEIKNIVETMPHGETVQKFLQILGPFYEFVDEDGEVQDEEDDDDDDEEEDENRDDCNGGGQNQHENEHIEHNNNVIDTNNSINTSFTGEQLNNNQLIKSQLNGFDSNYVHINSNSNSYYENLPNGTTTLSNVVVNGSSNKNEDDDDEDEDFCDTSDLLADDTVQRIKLLKSKLNNHQSDNTSDNASSMSNNINNSSGSSDSSNMFIVDTNNTNLNNTNVMLDENENFNNTIIKYGGESGSSASGYQARPSSTHSSASQQQQVIRSSNVNLSGSGSGGAGGGGFQPPPPPPPSANDPYGSYIQQNDTNRQILLLLMRLQQDTNNVLTRLSYLETTVMSIQNNLQMNRIENNMQAVNNNQQQVTTRNTAMPPDVNGSMSFFRYLLNAIDWKTVIIACIGPLVIRLVFLLLKKVKLIIKIRRNKPI